MPAHRTDKTPAAASLEGRIDAFNLRSWWEQTFTEAERARMTQEFEAAQQGVSRNTAAGLLYTLAGWLFAPEERDLARRLAHRAVELAEQKGDVADQHFAYLQLIRIYFRDREHDPEALAHAIDACERQIVLAPEMARIFGYPRERLPAHLGYERLTALREAQGDLMEALRLARQARQQGWLGAWDERIERLQAQMHNRGR